MNDPHLNRLAVAVRQEEHWQQHELARLTDLPVADRVSLGVSWAPLKFDEFVPRRSGGQLLLRAPRGLTLHDGIDVGALVRVAAVGGGETVTGRVVGLDRSAVEVRLNGWFESESDVSVTLVWDPTEFRRWLDGLDAAEVSRGGLKSALLGDVGAFREPLVHSAFTALNAAQALAAGAALASEELALIHGPPGTGKTRVLAALVEALVDHGRRPIALAQSNAATDHLALTASARLDVVRVGHPARMSGPAAELSLDVRVQQSASAQALKALDRDISRLHRETGGSGRRNLRELYQERRRIEDQAKAAILERCDVIASTLSTFALRAHQLPECHTAVVDEATQAAEPAVWAVVPYVKCLVMAGDPHQLGPVVKSPGNLLNRSLLERLLDEGHGAHRLEVQHRMHRDIQALVRSVYGDGYRPHPSVAEHRLELTADVGRVPWPPASFIDTAGADNGEQRDPLTKSLFNPLEVRLVDLAVRRLRLAGVRPDQIGVITPYSAQRSKLEALASLDAVEVATVNAFQGREKDVIVASFVRANPDGDLGFVSDQRRLTVAITRARKAFIGIGDSGTLTSQPAFVALLDAVDRAGGLMSVWDPDWDPGQ